jgi:hypothetical protein
VNCSVKKSNVDVYFEEFLRYEKSLLITNSGARSYYVLPILGCDLCINENLNKLTKLPIEKRSRFSIILVGKNEQIYSELISERMSDYTLIFDSLSLANKFQLSLGKPLMIKISQDNQYIEYRSVNDAEIENSLNNF